MKARRINPARALQVGALFLTVCALGFQPSALRAAGRSSVARNQADILFTDSQAAVLKANTGTRTPQVVAAGQQLEQPFGICVALNGEYLVSDTGSMALIALDPATGNQRVVSTGGQLGVPFGIATERNGAVLVANGVSLLRVNPVTGAQSILSTGGLFVAPVAVAVGNNGSIFVIDVMGSVIEVNSRTGEQTLIASGGYLNRPQGIAVKGRDLYVTDVATSDGNFGIGRIIHINARNGHQEVLSEGANLVGPVGISILNNGDLVVADPYTINEESQTLFDGGIIQINAATGRQMLLARGQQGFVNPRCVVALRISAVE